MAPEDLLALAAQLASEFQVGAAERDRTGALPVEGIESARRAGVLALTVPASHGGWGADLAAFARFQERVARGDASTALILAMHHMLVGGEAEAGLWPAAEWDEVCDAAVAAGALINAAATEPGAGSPSHGGLPATEAAHVAGEWRLTGRKAYTTGAPLLRYVRVAARVDAAAGEPYSARFLVSLPAEGATVLNEWDPVALKPSGGEDIVFEGTPARLLYREDRRGCEGNVWFQVAIAATYLGVGQAAHEAARDYAAGHRPRALEGPISDLDAVRLRLGRVRGRLLVARRHLFAVADEWVGLPRAAREGLVNAVALAKVTATEAAAFAAEEAMRVAGAAGLDRSLPLQRYLRETRAGLAHPPVEDVAYLALAREDLENR